MGGLEVVVVWRALRVGFLRLGVDVRGEGWAFEWDDMFRACVTALATSDASCWLCGPCSSGSGGASTKPSYALVMYHEFFHLSRSWAL